MLWVYDTTLSWDSDTTKWKMALDITIFWDFDNKPILSCHEDIITLSFPRTRNHDCDNNANEKCTKQCKHKGQSWNTNGWQARDVSMCWDGQQHLPKQTWLLRALWPRKCHRKWKQQFKRVLWHMKDCQVSHSEEGDTMSWERYNKTLSTLSWYSVWFQNNCS